LVVLVAKALVLLEQPPLRQLLAGLAARHLGRKQPAHSSIILGRPSLAAVVVAVAVVVPTPPARLASPLAAAVVVAAEEPLVARLERGERPLATL
jgi:hypothetical protein